MASFMIDRTKFPFVVTLDFNTIIDEEVIAFLETKHWDFLGDLGSRVRFFYFSNVKDAVEFKLRFG